MSASARPQPPHATAQPGASGLGPCREGALLAEGGMAEIRRGETADGRVVAIKRIRTSMVFDSDFKRLFADERALCACLDHPHIVELLDSGEDDCGPYMVFEFVDGTDLGVVLQSRIDASRPLEVAQVLAIGMGMLDALAYAHSCCADDGASLAVVHRDVSPGNILLGLNGDVKLADFGVASSSLRTDHTVAGEMKGKFAYMAPEQTRGAPVTPACDLFAAGIVLHECLTGKRCYDGPTDADVVAAVREAEVPRPDALNPDVPAELADVVMQLLQKSPEARPESARTAYEALRDVAEAYCLDQGHRRHIGRLAREHPRAAASESALAPRRATQRVLGDTGPAVRVQPAVPERSKTPLVVALVAALVVGGVVVAMARPGGPPPDETQPGFSGNGIVATPLPDEPSRPGPPRGAETPMHPVVNKVAAPDARALAGEVKPTVTAAPGANQEKRPEVTSTRPRTPRNVRVARAPVGAKVRGAGKRTPTGAAAQSPTEVGEKLARAKRADAARKAAAAGFGVVNISSQPWAEVYIDGAKFGITPLAKRQLPAGRHAVRLYNPHYELEERFFIDVKANETLTRFRDLSKAR